MTNRDRFQVVAGGLEGAVAVVTGASRGVGRGIAEELGAQGAIVYVTGRTRTPASGPSVDGEVLPGSVTETADAVTRAGGHGIPVVCDSSDDDQLRDLFGMVKKDHGRLDVLVNNAFIVSDLLKSGRPFWELPISLWDEVFDVGVRSTFVASHLAANIMVPQRRGLIVGISAPWAKVFRYTTAYGVAKTAVDRLAFDLAHELLPYRVASISLWLGFIRTERVQAAARRDPDIDLGNTESPNFVGRAVAALASDPEILARSGRAWYTADLASEFGFTDIDGKSPRSRRGLYGPPLAFGERNGDR